MTTAIEFRASSSSDVQHQTGVPERNHPEISNSPERHQRNPDSVNKGKALMQRSQQVKHQEEMAKDWEGDEKQQRGGDVQEDLTHAHPGQTHQQRDDNSAQLRH